MQEQEPIGPTEQALSDALGALELTPMSASARHLWYRAGFEAGRRRTKVWRAVAAMVILVAGTTMIWSAKSRPAPRTIERVVYVPREQPSRDVSREFAAEGSAPELSTAYLKLRDAVIERGLNGLPRSGRGSSPGSGMRAWPVDSANAVDGLHS